MSERWSRPIQAVAAMAIAFAVGVCGCQGDGETDSGGDYQAPTTSTPATSVLSVEGSTYVRGTPPGPSAESPQKPRILSIQAPSALVANASYAIAVRYSAPGVAGLASAAGSVEPQVVVYLRVFEDDGYHKIFDANDGEFQIHVSLNPGGAVTSFGYSIYVQVGSWISEAWNGSATVGGSGTSSSTDRIQCISATGSADPVGDCRVLQWCRNLTSGGCWFRATKGSLTQDFACSRCEPSVSGDCVQSSYDFCAVTLQK